jgi:hypothetical protein
MYFNWRGFLKDSLYALTPQSRNVPGMTGRRARILVMFFICMVWMGFGGRLGLAIDRLLFPGYRRTAVRRPVFIVGNFRSGSTYLHRMIAALPGFTAMKTWEIYFAPSIVQRKLWRGIWLLDKLFGAPIKSYLLTLQEKKLGEVRMHRIRLQEAEEDEGLFLYLWESLFNWFFITRDVPNSPYWQFDQRVPTWRKRKVRRFYRSCIQRHLHVHGEQSVYIAKNPSLTAKIGTLLDEFPDARIIYLVRHPLDAVVSVMGWFSFAWRYFAAIDKEFAHRETVMALTRSWYLSPLPHLDRLPKEQCVIVRYEDLVQRPEAVVPALLSQLQLPVPKTLAGKLSAAPRRDPNDRSHSLKLSNIGLSEESAMDYFRDVLNRYGYDERSP